MKEVKFNLNVPYSWRKGQTVFNFLEWLQTKGFKPNQSYRMADCFHIQDEEFDKLFEEFIKKYESNNN